MSTARPPEGARTAARSAEAPLHTARPPAGWTAERERGHPWLVGCMGRFAVVAGRPLARLLLHPIALYFLLANGRARRASRQYLSLALQRPARLADVYRHIHHFAATVLDRVYFLRDRTAGLDLRVQGAEALQQALAGGQGVVLVGAHLGSFEALRAAGQGVGGRIAMLMYEDNARQINATLRALAPRAALHTIALGRPGAMLALKRWLDEGGMAGMLADRSLPGAAGRARSVALPFLGRPAPFSDGPFRLAALLRRPVFFMAGLYHGGARYTLRLEPLADFRAAADAGQQLAAAQARYVALLEALCREAPYNWFNFYDFWAGDVPTPPSAR